MQFGTVNQAVVKAEQLLRRSLIRKNIRFPRSMPVVSGTHDGFEFGPYMKTTLHDLIRMQEPSGAPGLGLFPVEMRAYFLMHETEECLEVVAYGYNKMDWTMLPGAEIETPFEEIKSARKILIVEFNIDNPIPGSQGPQQAHVGWSTKFSRKVLTQETGHVLFPAHSHHPGRDHAGSQLVQNFIEGLQEELPAILCTRLFSSTAISHILYATYEGDSTPSQGHKYITPSY